MLLYELAYACRIYAATFDTALENFRKAVAPQLNPENPDHRSALLKWLNQWGCRQFIKRDHPRASTAILRWWQQQQFQNLPPRTITLAALADSDLDALQNAYGALVPRVAATRL
jgi:hypothetical protein